jgi:hypothetical protein
VRPPSPFVETLEEEPGEERNACDWVRREGERDSLSFLSASVSFFNRCSGRKAPPKAFWPPLDNLITPAT